MHPTIATTIQSLAGQTIAQRPSPADLVDALLDAEKQTRKQRFELTYKQLLGTWQLRFITGIKRSRQKAGMALGAGRFIPPWLVRIQIQYSLPDSPESTLTNGLASEQLSSEFGVVRNSVQLGLLTLALSGPTRLWSKSNRLAFDFTHVEVAIAGKTVYQGAARGGDKRTQDFASQKLKDQAFFTYFFVEEDAIAARGRGGGLALWTKVKPD
ncbi:MAG: hypothetical protein AAGD25_40350 [Cyanobacteria bacterium P01_F01_bin.150]